MYQISLHIEPHLCPIKSVTQFHSEMKIMIYFQDDIIKKCLLKYKEQNNYIQYRILVMFKKKEIEVIKPLLKILNN